MNVIVANEQKSVLSALEIDIIKSVEGVFEVDEIVNMFKNFFFGRMILDVTAIKDYHDTVNLQKLSLNLDVEKIILLLPSTDSQTGSSAYLSKLVSMGIYNFTTNLEGVKYLLDHPNTYRDVAHIQQFNELSDAMNDKIRDGARILGIKNVTDHAGSTTLIYMLKRELEARGLSVVAIEVGKRDFQYFNSKGMVSVAKDQVATEILKQKEVNVILIDLNDSDDDGTCNDVLYLIEPSSIRLNKLMRRDRRVFENLKGKKIVLNKSLLSNSDIMDFEYESKSKVFYNIPPVNEREKNSMVSGLLAKLGFIRHEKENDGEKNKILGLFKL